LVTLRTIDANGFAAKPQTGYVSPEFHKDSKDDRACQSLSMFYGIIVMMYYFDDRRLSSTHSFARLAKPKWGDEDRTPAMWSLRSFPTPHITLRAACLTAWSIALAQIVTAKRLSPPAQGCRRGYPGIMDKRNNIQPQRGCVIYSAHQKTGATTLRFATSYWSNQGAHRFAGETDRRRFDDTKSDSSECEVLWNDHV